MANLNAKVDIWKNKLLDMSLRNKLLNYRETKRSTLRIISPNIYSLWNSLVVNEKPLVFPMKEEEEKSEEEIEVNYNDKSFSYPTEYQTERGNEGSESLYTAQQEDTAEEEHFSDRVITNQSVNERQKTLRNIRTRSRNFMEEQGINVLYLSFGFLQWKESSSSSELHDAPLILVPVTLKLSSIVSPFELELHEDEIVVNPTLAYKLDNDFGLKLPEFDIEEPIEDFFRKVEEVTASNNWNVLREVSLGMLSFLKINMYQDLEAHRKKILENPVIRAIGGDDSDIKQDLSEIDHYDFDHKTKPIDTFQVVDADSSQQDAILCAQKGISFVLQGPPGTGKSQTITNIIAQCLADGKKVLFVSEKMAALDVVYHRLDEANLSDFCFVLHSNKANKKETIEQLGDVLTLAEDREEITREEYRSLDRLMEDRDKLNKYSEEVYTVIDPLHKSIYEANGILSGVLDYEDVIFNIPDIREISAERYNTIINMLDRFAEMINMQKVDYRENPWQGANVGFVTNELRHDLSARSVNLMESVNALSNVHTDVCEKLSVKIPNTYAGVCRLLAIFGLVRDRVYFQSEWIIDEETDNLMQEVSQFEELKEKFIKKRTEIFERVKRIEKDDGNIDLSEHKVLATSVMVEELASELNGIIEKDGCYYMWEDRDALERLNVLCDEAKEVIASYNELKDKILEDYEKEILGIDFNEIYFRYKEKSTSAVKFLNGQYREDKKLIKSMYKKEEKLSDEDILAVLTLLRDMQDKKAWLDEHHEEIIKLCPKYYNDEETDFESIERHEEAYGEIKKVQGLVSEFKEIVEQSEASEDELRKHYGKLYSGIETDWNTVKGSLNWAKEFAEEWGDMLQDNEEFITRLSNDTEIAEECEELSAELRIAKEAADEDFTWFTSMFDDSRNFEEMSFTEFTDQLRGCCENLAALEEWIDYKGIRQQCIEYGLEEYMNLLEKSEIRQDHIVPVFKKRFFRLWLDSVLPEYPAVANFRRRNQENNVSEFCKLDKSQFAVASKRIRYKLIGNLPSADHFTSGGEEINILRRELNKKRKIMPIRKLFSKIPHLIMNLKPCLMMSPLSVSLYLESDAYEFDTVIFDEASQVFTENAIGAIFRGKQVIIAGDSKQLPPTNFFTATLGGEEYDDDEDEEFADDTDAFESILDEAALLPERTLLWHYRSRNEELIAFSNAKIYNNSLITFPSTAENIPDMGVEYTYVEDGYYDRGGRRGNVNEAKKVAEMVFEHFRSHPERSLGVIAFGEAQQNAIDTALREMRQEDQELEAYFSEDIDDAFFIKSLENVQGDERDTIILSIGYAKDIHGVMRMNFGPLQTSGGERRLNVAITRAKYNLKLVGSILPTDLNLSHITSEGPKLLRSYIEFAINGPSSLANEVTESDVVWHDSPFEESVYQFLDKKGYKLATQVGCSGYRIDIAVKHPTIDGRYVLGIECDGASYHSARTVRERDRLRQDVLEGIGWKIYRIWSTDWIKDPVTEGKRLVSAIENAIKNPVSEVAVPVKERQLLEKKVRKSPSGKAGTAQIGMDQAVADLSRKGNANGYYTSKSKAKQNVEDDGSQLSFNNTNTKQANIVSAETEKDKHLLEKYPVAYREVYNLLSDYKIFHSPVSSLEVWEKTGRTELLSVIEEILNNATWSKKVVGGYHLADEAGNVHEVKLSGADDKEEDDGAFVINLRFTRNYSSICPCFFSYLGESKTPCNSWKDLYVTFVSTFLHDYPYILKPGMAFSNSGRVDLATREKNNLASPVHVPGTNYVLETCLSANDMVRRMKYIMDMCDLDYKNVVIKCKPVSATKTDTRSGAGK